MAKPLSAVALALTLALAACASAPPPAPAPPAAPPPDPHAFEADEYLVSPDTLSEDWKATVWVYIAKMEKPAAGDDGATFFLVKGDGSTLKSKVFWKTRPAAKGDLKPGVVVACFSDGAKDGVYLPPKDKTTSRNGRWVAGHVTDIAEMDKDVVRVGTDRCLIGSMRVLTAPGK